MSKRLAQTRELPRLSRRGRLFLGATSSLLAAGAVTSDLVLTSISVALLLVLALDYSVIYAIVRNPASRLSLETLGGQSDSITEVENLVAGDKRVRDFSLTKRVRIAGIIRGDIPELSISPGEIGRDETQKNISVSFRAERTGKFESRAVLLDLRSVLGFFWGGCSLEIAKRYAVRPRITDVAAQTLSLLARRRVAGEAILDRRGSGGDYYEVREYSPGDKTSRVNWKATARRSKLMVNEYSAAATPLYLLVLDAVSSRTPDRDRLAATFLGVANALYLAQLPFWVCSADERRVLYESDAGPVRRSLETALVASTDFADARLEVPERLLDVTSSLRKEISGWNPKTPGAEGKGLDKLMALGNTALSSHRAADGLYEWIDRVAMTQGSEGSGADFSLFYFTNLAGEEAQARAIALAGYLSSLFGSRTQLRLVCTAKPWVTESTESGAVSSLYSLEKKLTAMRTAGMSVLEGEPEECVRAVALGAPGAQELSA